MHRQICPRGTAGMADPAYAVGWNTNVRAFHLQTDLGRNCRAVPTHVGSAGAEYAGALQRLHTLTCETRHGLIDVIVIRCLFGGVALNAKAGVGAAVEECSHLAESEIVPA